MYSLHRDIHMCGPAWVWHISIVWYRIAVGTPAHVRPIAKLTQNQSKISINKDKDKDKDLFIGPQEFVVGYSKAPEQPQSSARPVCHSHTMTRTGREPATVRIAA